jgi:hypothetical protein
VAAPDLRLVTLAERRLAVLRKKMRVCALLAAAGCGSAAEDGSTSGREANLGVAGAHEHGVARLDIGVEGREAHLQFAVPGVSIYGFEGAPRSEEQRQQQQEGLQRFQAGVASLVRFAGEAECEADDVRLLDEAGQPLDVSSLAAADAAGHGHDDNRHGHDDNRHGHDDNRHSHEGSRHGHEGDRHGHAETAAHGDTISDHAHEVGVHGEVQLTAVFVCGRPLAGTVLRVEVGRLLPDVTSVDLQVVSEARQFGARVPAVGYAVRLEE